MHLGLQNKVIKSPNASYIKIDLSLNNPNLLEKLEQLPAPDIILASPPCESWSVADGHSRQINLVDNEFKLNNYSFYQMYNKIMKPKRQRSFIQKQTKRILGESTITQTINIIQHFKPKIWIIENPRNSLMWNYIESFLGFNGIKNKTYYSNYDLNFSQKPTIFYSNIELNLKYDFSIKGNKNFYNSGNYESRSKIPKDLIIDIIKQCQNKLENYESSK
ncbi:putative C5 cytosine methyltransferase (MAV1virus-like) [Mycoplasma sp. NEAQ87857]|nr:putative C5 cytosine methyltransferase (MAV1virus-like) [Mycoplasma sp. NEAQ87857]